MANASAQARECSLPAAPVSRRAEVLLAEDDRELRRFLSMALRKDGCRVTEAESGHELLDCLWERARSGRGFDLIISDNRMPGFSGLQVLEGLREECEPRIGDTPIMIITAFGDAQLHADAERLGAVVFDKPFDVDDLRAFALKSVRPVEEHGSSYPQYGGGD